PDHEQLDAGRADADHVARVEHGVAVHRLLVDERPVTAEILDAKLAVAEPELAVQARDAALLSVDRDRPAAVDRGAADDDAVDADRIRDAPIDDVRRHGVPGGRIAGGIERVVQAVPRLAHGL